MSITWSNDMAEAKTELEQVAARVADELEQTAEHGSDAAPHWKRVYDADLRRMARQLRGEQ